jgi:hypothetical protein
MFNVILRIKTPYSIRAPVITFLNIFVNVITIKSKILRLYHRTLHSQRCEILKSNKTANYSLKS